MEKSPLVPHLCEAWVALGEGQQLIETLELALTHCSDSLKALFQDTQSQRGVRLIGEMVRYVETGERDAFTAATDAFREARTTAAEGRSWDYGKGPYLALSLPAEGSMQGVFARLTSRCQTVTLTVERTNIKFPAKPGEANVPQLRCSLQLNPFDTAKFDSCFEFVRSSFLALNQKGQQIMILVAGE